MFLPFAQKEKNCSTRASCNHFCWFIALTLHTVQLYIRQWKGIWIRVEIYREEDMYIVEEKKCPVCGGKVIGRSDKKYCCDSCRIFAANRRGNEMRKRLKESGAICSIERDLKILGGDGGGAYIKIIALVTGFCKILYKFGRKI